ncbi:hypothetical protein ACEWY4_016048 [Coilia grayii]|uniref:G-protein coupled receptors family 1 profile domain-containing protein n=1 Tax=Coilia grayii TaxID=363190 RepID=A0ABD1JQN1_9TELE
MATYINRKLKVLGLLGLLFVQGVSMMRQDWFEEHFGQHGQRLKDLTSWLKLRAANGKEIPYLGEYNSAAAVPEEDDGVEVPGFQEVTAEEVQACLLGSCSAVSTIPAQHQPESSGGSIIGQDWTAERTPLDVMLGHPVDQQNTVEEWVRRHHERLHYAYKRAGWPTCAETLCATICFSQRPSVGLDGFVHHWLTAQLKSHCSNMEYVNHSSSNSPSISLKQQVSTGLLGVCFLLGVPADVAVVVFILRHFKKDNFTLHLMLNLAASDILRLVSVPVWMYTLNFGWTFGRTLCKLIYLIAFTSAYSSVLTVTLMSVQRYVVVLHRSQWAMLGSKGEKVLLFCLWTLALILSSPAAVKADVVEGQNRICMRTDDEETLGILLYETLLGFVLPFSIIAMSYFCLHKQVNQTTLFSNPRLTKLMIAILQG